MRKSKRQEGVKKGVMEGEEGISHTHTHTHQKEGFQLTQTYRLGGLITWDILAHQRADLTDEEREQFKKFDVDVPKLDFKPDYLFGMGCPVAGLLVSRNQDPRLYHPDSDVIFENIYHPFDPLVSVNIA